MSEFSPFSASLVRTLSSVLKEFFSISEAHRCSVIGIVKGCCCRNSRNCWSCP